MSGSDPVGQAEVAFAGTAEEAPTVLPRGRRRATATPDLGGLGRVCVRPTRHAGLQASVKGRTPPREASPVLPALYAVSDAQSVKQFPLLDEPKVPLQPRLLSDCQGRRVDELLQPLKCRREHLALAQLLQLLDGFKRLRLPSALLPVLEERELLTCGPTSAVPDVPPLRSRVELPLQPVGEELQPCVYPLPSLLSA